MSVTDDRVLGLSARARRLVFPLLAATALVVAIGQLLVGQGIGKSGTDDAASGAAVGGDIHAVAQLGSRVFVGGHSGAARWSTSTGWQQLHSLDDKDVMSWSQSGGSILAGGHSGLFISTDGGASFSAVPDFEGVDVHAVGSSERTIYLASPASGLYVSTDDGKSFGRRSTAGASFMGSIWVDPEDARHAIAPSMQGGAMQTSDGGRTWTALGGPTDAMSVAVDSSGQRLVVIGMGGAQRTTDGGRTWQPLDVPESTSAATYTADGELLTAALSDGRAQVARRTGAGWKALD